MANNLSISKKIQILNMLCEGSSMRSISRVVDCSINTVTKLLVETGRKCAEYHDTHARNLKCTKVEVDEIWAFCYGKTKTVGSENGKGDVWTWTAVDPDSRMVLAWESGQRTIECAYGLLGNLQSRLANRVQLTSDGNNSYIKAVEGVFGDDIDYGMLVKTYTGTELVIDRRAITGKPHNISTSKVERQNLSMRMSMRRFTRKTNAHSKKMENHRLALALYFCFFNFIRIHSSLRVTPAMEAGIATSPMSWEDFL